MLAETAAASVPPTYGLGKLGDAVRYRSARLRAISAAIYFALPRLGFYNWDLVAIGLILLYQFVSGKFLIQYDRLLWFLAFGLAVTCSLLLNFSSTMLTAYFQFVVFFSLFTLNRRSSPDQYKQDASVVSIPRNPSIVPRSGAIRRAVRGGWQKAHRFLRDSSRFSTRPSHDQGTSGPRTFGKLIKSNALFLSEPSISRKSRRLAYWSRFWNFVGRDTWSLWRSAFWWLIAGPG